MSQLIKTARDVADAMRMAKDGDGLGKTIFLIGAGCSVSAGVPDARSIAKNLTLRLAKIHRKDFSSDEVEAFRWLVATDRLPPPAEAPPPKQWTTETINWHDVYDALFERHFQTPDDMREIFDGYLSQNEQTTNWAHLCLGELAAGGWVSTVLTTNFDQLVLKGMAHAGIVPAISDGLESLNRISPTPRHVQLIEIHGSRHSYQLRNNSGEVGEVGDSAVARGAIQALFQAARNFIVIGYEGREKGVMSLLVDAAKAYRDKCLFWVAHAQSCDRLSPQAKDFLATSRNGGVLLGQDADAFFLALNQKLGVGAPSVLTQPLRASAALLKHFAKRPPQNRDIAAEVDEARRRIEHLQNSERNYRPDPAAEIRELRLKGDLAGAWAEAVQATAKEDATAECLFEAGLAAIEYAPRLTLSSVTLETFEKAADWLRRAVTLYSHANALREVQRVAQKNLGIALLNIGERNGEIAIFGEAVGALRAALQFCISETTPREQAIIQSNLGQALLRIGEQECDDAKLEQAVDALCAALEFYTLETTPEEWAATQSALGHALLRVGERKGDIEILQNAVAACRCARKIRTRATMPKGCAANLFYLGAALQDIGERRHDPKTLREAVEAYRESLEIRTREASPKEWAMTQNGLGAALSFLGQLTQDWEILREAIKIFGEALGIRTREASPKEWAMTQYNLGAALSFLGQLTHDPEILREAVEAYREALGIRTREAWPKEWALTQYGLGVVFDRMVETTGNPKYLRDAIGAFHAALEIFTFEAEPVLYKQVQQSLGPAETRLAELTDAAPEDEAREESSPDSTPTPPPAPLPKIPD